MKTLLIWLVGLLAAAPLAAHDPGLSGADVRLLPEAVEAKLSFNPADLGIGRQELETARPRLRELAGEAMIVSFDGLPAEPFAADATWTETDGSPNIEMLILFARPAEAKQMGVVSALLGDLPRGHRQYLRVLFEDGALVADAMLDSENNTYEMEIEASSTSGALGSFFALGVEHILTGYDHLLFLAALLLVAPGFRAAAAIVTSFTLAHSLTLGLAAVDIVRVPSSVVEPLIAASVVWVGAENLIKGEVRGRWKLTFAFGLVHGLGFAGVLRELGIQHTPDMLAALFGFNLGVEAGQIALTAAALPLLMRATAQANRQTLVGACSAAIVLFGVLQFAERTVMAH